MELGRTSELIAVVALLASISAAILVTSWNAGNDSARLSASRRVPTERSLLSLRGATRRQVQSAMAAAGMATGDSLEFLSNARHGQIRRTIDVTFTFGPDGRVAVIQAYVGGPRQEDTIQFLWDSRGLECSDFPGSQHRCNPS
jgi:hypothetical protein